MRTIHFQLPFSNKTLTHNLVSKRFDLLGQRLLKENIQLQAGKIGLKPPHADAYVFANIPSLTLVDVVVRLKQRGAIVVWFLDDDAWNPPAHGRNDITPLHLAALNQVLNLSDQVWVTSYHLKARLTASFTSVAGERCSAPSSMPSLNPARVKLVPSLIDVWDYGQLPGNSTAKRCLWAGSASHLADLDLIRKNRFAPQYNFLVVDFFQRQGSLQLLAVTLRKTNLNPAKDVRL